MHIRCRIYSSKSTRKRLAAGLRLDPLGSLSAPPDPLAAKGAGEGWKEGRGRGRQGKEKGRRGGGGEGKGREGGVEGKRRAPTYFAVIRPLVKSDLRWGYRAEKEV